MKEKWDKLDIYNDSAIVFERKTPKSIISFITVLVLLFVLFIIFSIIPFNIYKPYIGYIDLKGEDTLFISKLEYSDFPIIKNKVLYIKGEKYKYDILNLEDNKLVLKINLSEKLKIQKNILTVNILKNRTTIFKIIINKIKKGFGV